VKKLTDEDIKRLISLYQGTGDSVVYWNDSETGYTIAIEFSGLSSTHLKTMFG
jgi:hypothetical protein